MIAPKPVFISSYCWYSAVVVVVVVFLFRLMALYSWNLMESLQPTCSCRCSSFLLTYLTTILTFVDLSWPPLYFVTLVTLFQCIYIYIIWSTIKHCCCCCCCCTDHKGIHVLGNCLQIISKPTTRKWCDALLSQVGACSIAENHQTHVCQKWDTNHIQELLCIKEVQREMPDAYCSVYLK